MSILDRLRTRLDTLAAASLPVLADRLAFSAEIPAGAFGALMKIDVQMHSEAHGDGERVRMRAHLQTNFASVLKPMLASPPPAPKSRKGSSRALAPIDRAQQIASRGVRRAFANPVVKRFAEPLLRNDINTWVDLTASTASLDEGAHALVPKSEKLDALGIRPTRKDGSHAETWSGSTASGSAQVSMLQVNKDSLPKSVKKRLGPQPFNLAAVIVNTVDEK
ncbi:MAG TPA: hypothetical protein VJM11_15870 [Nevskiaceae bacterium]|nr:hypothetical protein [Nevskiaceae bacterium]